MNYASIIKFFVLASVLILPTSAFSESLTITDSQGVLRAEQVVDKGQNASLQFTVDQASATSTDPIQVTLTNHATGETLEVTVQNGVAVFENVPAGSWAVSTPTAGVTFTSIEITSAAAAGALASAGIPGTVIAVGGVGAIATTAAITANNDDNESDPLSPIS